ncbi:hypothetical protein RJ640_006274 [Escallonia rubra]|uniref:GAG-pre-integrase domain-containing protein n=1 Tax=Escallonia rubra TaxID=112253 RepID=A0AA88UJ84_9ASTE|nr:hypothetical protein RJ640_006274 [Escallonia rubra]
MDAHEAQLFSMDDKAKNIISYGLDMNEYNRVSACETAREMWRLLEVTHEGTNQVKETKINMLIQQYEAFKMKEHESINEIYFRFTLIINGLKLLGKTYPEKEVVRKVLRSLPKRWEAKLITIQEAKDLNVLKLEELVGSLMTHEITMKIHDEEETTCRKKNLTLTSHEPTESSDDSDPEMALITRRIGHIKIYCPQLKNKTASNNSQDFKEKKFKPRKALLTWDDSDNSDKETSEDDDVAQLCFMAKDDHSDKFNLISISQLIDSGHKVQFEGDQCLISHALDGGTLVGKRDDNIYTPSFDASDSFREFCLSAQHNDIWLWHRRLGHVHMDLIKKLLSKELVRGLPKLKFVKDKQSIKGIFISQSEDTRELLKRFGLDNAKPRGTPISPGVNIVKDEKGKDVDNKLYRGLWYPRNSSLDLVGFSDSNYAGCLVDRKSTSGTCQFLGDALVSWHSKKQMSVALSTAEAKYVAAGSCCA